MDIKSVKIKTETYRKVQKAKDSRYFGANIPLNLLAKASKLSGKALSLYLLICHIRKVSSSDDIIIKKHLLDEFGISRGAKSRAIEELSKEGLINYKSRKGKAPIITLVTD